MKKLILILLAAAMVTGLAACGNGAKQTQSTSNGSDGSQVNTGDPSGNQTGETTTNSNNPSVNPNPGGISDETKAITGFEPAGEKKVTNFSGEYTATYTGSGFEANVGIDYSKYDFTGSGADLIYYCTEVMKEQQNWCIEDSKGNKKAKRLKYLLYQADTGEYKSIASTSSISKYEGVLANFEFDESSVTAKMIRIDPKISVQVSKVSASSGTYLMLEYYSNVQIRYQASIGKNTGTKNVDQNKHHADKFRAAELVKEDNGVSYYKGYVQVTVPYVEPGEYNITLFTHGGSTNKHTVVTDIPLTITDGGKYEDAEYHLLFGGDWARVTAKGYEEQLIDLFYNTYSRLVARFNTAGRATKTVTFSADPDYIGGVAYSQGTAVVVFSDYASSHPNDIGFFSHEITHQVQQYSSFSSSWWTENMANFGGFRYFHWANANGKYVQVYKPSDSQIWDWGYQPYGDGSKLFFSFMDYMYPSTPAADGKTIEKRGLIDSINYAIQHGQLKSDAGTNDPNSAMSKIVQEVSGGRFESIEALRLYYVEISKKWEDTDGKEGWWFQGFGDYTDNFITEDLPFTENPNYPMIRDTVRGNQTADRLATPVTEGTNLLSGATIVKDSGNTSSSAPKLIDGKVNTVWSSNEKTLGDYTCTLNGVAGYVVFDLGEAKTFDTYTLYHGTSKNPASRNNTDWELLVSDDGENWTSVDNQTGMGKEGIESYKIPSTTARYVMIRLYPNAGSSVYNVTLYEMMLF